MFFALGEGEKLRGEALGYLAVFVLRHGSV
jgi:hypothetical protein